ncbi:MAG: hypothetical protein PF508_18960 [Spirochaeta sp.]|nr:hypothetical protein [Spirochaeta sp.]
MISAETLLVETAPADALPANDVVPDDPLIVALIQFAVEEEEYTDHARFRREIDQLLQVAVNRHGAEFVVFPEYVNVFALLDNYSRRITGAEEIDDLAPIIGAAGGIPQLLRQEIRTDTPEIKAIWSELARTYGVWILAGTAFVETGDGALRNQAWLFAPDGRLSYRQDKVFLTPFERHELRLTPGNISRARPFEIDGVSFGLSICRDSYFDEWEVPYADVDLWLDVRANGEIWNGAVRRRFDTAMPERVAETAVDGGLSTSLNGAYLEMVWQGPAFVVDEEGRRTAQADTIDGDAILIVAIR